MNKIIQVIYSCGIITKEEVEKQKLTSGLNRLLKNKEVEEYTYDNITYYTSSELGEKVFQYDNPDMKFFYRGFKIEKLLRLMDYYLELSKEEQLTWQTKDELLSILSNEKALDSTYVSDGKLVGLYVMDSSSNKNIEELLTPTIDKLRVDNVHIITF